MKKTEGKKTHLISTDIYLRIRENKSPPWGVYIVMSTLPTSKYFKHLNRKSGWQASFLCNR